MVTRSSFLTEKGGSKQNEIIWSKKIRFGTIFPFLFYLKSFPQKKGKRRMRYVINKKLRVGQYSRPEWTVFGGGWTDCVEVSIRDFVVFCLHERIKLNEALSEWKQSNFVTHAEMSANDFYRSLRVGSGGRVLSTTTAMATATSTVLRLWRRNLVLVAKLILRWWRRRARLPDASIWLIRRDQMLLLALRESIFSAFVSTSAGPTNRRVAFHGARATVIYTVSSRAPFPLQYSSVWV